MAFPGLTERVAQVREQIAAHQARRGWSHAVSIIAVTKGHGAEAVRAAYDAGVRDVGENRVQEALAKQEAVSAVAVQWHLIGGLQRNKARQAVGRFSLIHSVDRVDLALELDRRTAPTTRQSVLLQVNCSGEPQKGGVEPDSLLELLDAIRSLEHLEVRGLMTMAALSIDAELQRSTFGRLRELRDRAERAGHRVPELSMGMSGDYLVAVEEGATMVRLGTLLFGERDL